MVLHVLPVEPLSSYSNVNDTEAVVYSATSSHVLLVATAHCIILIFLNQLSKELQAQFSMQLRIEVECQVEESVFVDPTLFALIDV